MSEKTTKKLLLKWHDDKGEFQPIVSEADIKEGIFIELDEEKQSWKYFYITGASLIARRTALRAANGISKTGYMHPKNNIRYGVECKLVEDKSPYEDMPTSLRKEQRDWYLKVHKKPEK